MGVSPSERVHDVPGLLLEGVARLRSGEWTLRSWETDRVHRHHGRYFVYGRMRYTDASNGVVETAPLAVKVYKGDHGDRAFLALQQLWSAGFRAPAEHRVPRPFGFVRERRVLIQETVPPDSWAKHMFADGSGAAPDARRAAQWLVRLQSQVLGEVGSGGTSHPFSRIGSELVARLPEHEARLNRASRRLWELLGQPQQPVLSHGDYHPENVHLSADAVWGIDFDNFGKREPAYDVGYAIGELLIMSRLRSGSFTLGARTALEFWQEYAVQGTATWDRVAVQVARTFLQSLHYELCTLANGRIDLLDPWMTHVEAWLTSGGPEILEDPLCDR